jgi:hypothetical protein
MDEDKSARAISRPDSTDVKLNVKAFAVACGLLWGVGLFLFTWWVMAFDGATGQPTVIGLLYRGYRISPLGSLIGLLWAIPDGFVGGIIFAWLYNLVANLGG